MKNHQQDPKNARNRMLTRMQSALLRSLANRAPHLRRLPFIIKSNYSRCLSNDGRPAQSESPNSTEHRNVQGPVTWKSLTVMLALGTAGLAYYSYEHERRLKEITSPKAVGRAAIGGSFSLVDEHGKPFTDKDLLGRWTLIYFGFTMCPDICPEEMTKLSEALQRLEKRGVKVAADSNASITPIFISIDPERDTPERSAEYARGFHPAFVGVSGSMNQVTDAAKKYRVYFSKDETPGDEYLVDHSIISYLMDPSGEFQEFYGKNTSAVEIASRIEAKLMSWKHKKVAS